MDLGRLAARSLIAAVAGWIAAAGLEGGATSHACCTEVGGSYFAVGRPRNTLVMVPVGDDPPSLRRVAPTGPPGRRRWSESIPLAPLGVGDLWRPERLLEVGAEYEVVVGSDVWYRFIVERDVDVSPPDFAGVKAATFRRHDVVTSGDDGPGREIVIAHDPLPAGVAFIVVSVRRHGPGEIASRQTLGLRRGMMGDRHLTVLSSSCGYDKPPPIEVGATYCVSVIAHDAAGNASGGDVEVCSPVIDCRDPGWGDLLRCPQPHGTAIYLPGPDEVQLKEVTLPVWASPRMRSLASVVAVLVVFAAWRWRRRRARSLPRWA